MVDPAFGYNTVLGPDGRPAPLSDAQAMEALIGAFDSSQAAAFRIPPYNPDILIQRQGYRVLDEQLRLAAVRAPLNIVRFAVLRKGWEAQAAVTDPNDSRAEEAQKRAEHLTHDLTHIENRAGKPQDFRHALWELLYGVHAGFQLIEIVPKLHEDGPHKGQWGFAEFAAKPQIQIGFEVNAFTLSPESFTSFTPKQGFQTGIPHARVLYYVFCPMGNRPWGSPTGAAVYKHSWSIEFLMKFWNLGLEKFGSPNYKATAPAALMALVAAVLDKLRQGGAAVFPQGAEAELLQAATGGLEGFRSACEWHAMQCALAYENSVLTSGEGQTQGSKALGQVHQESSEYGHCFVREDIEGVLNLQLVPRWYAWNYGPNEPELCPRLTLGDWDEVDMATMATAFRTLTEGGFGHPQEPVWRQRLKLPPVDPASRKLMEQEQQDKRARDERALSIKERRNATPRN